MIRYLVGIDGSDLSAAALDQAAQLAAATGAKLLLVHVAPHAEAAAIGDPAALSALTDRTELHDMHGHEVLREALARAEKHGVQVETLFKHGPAAEIIAELAEGRDVAMVVVGHRGRNLAARLLIGSVADRLVQISPKPVLVIR